MVIQVAGKKPVSINKWYCGKKALNSVIHDHFSAACMNFSTISLML
jgi:hypothetical protein